MVEYEGMLAETVLFRGHDGDRISGYLARPLGEGPYPGVIVIHEVFGLVTHIKELARKISARGYVALAPDLHHPEGPGDPADVGAAVRAAVGRGGGRRWAAGEPPLGRGGAAVSEDHRRAPTFIPRRAVVQVNLQEEMWSQILAKLA